jgi:purine-cytosine permease-like protein
MTGFGLGWVNAGADYSRYLPRSAPARGVVGWTTFGASIAPIVLVLYGLLAAGSDEELRAAISSDPVGALTTILPTWYLVPFAIVAIGGLIGGAVLDIYSSGLTLLTLGVRVPRWTAAAIDGVLMILGTIYLVWISESFFGTFQAFLILLGVPIAAWVGIFIADLFTRRKPYGDADLYDSRGRYGSLNPLAVVTLVVATFIGWGLVISFDPAFDWLGYLLDPLGLGGREGDWAFANIGVLVALVLGFVVQFVGGRRAVERQESAV